MIVPLGSYQIIKVMIFALVHIQNNEPIVIEGLWALEFRFDPETCCARLFFTSGPEDEEEGLVGLIGSGTKSYRSGSIRLIKK